MNLTKEYNGENLKKDTEANLGRPYQQCSISVMDTIEDPNITFDENGVCNYYYDYLNSAKANIIKGVEAEKKISETIALLKRNGKHKKYDCIIGVSGGVDSTYLSYKAKEFGLRVLCVHFDNGWNSELAVKNIENIVSKCGFDLYTYVIDWDEFRDIQLSYFKAGVIDIEAVNDIGIFDALDRICSEFGIKYILDGRNIATECTLPSYWINKNQNNLYQIHKKFGTIPLNKFPAKFKNGLYVRPKGSYIGINLLNFIDYNKKQAKKTITKELEWRDYGGKHYESIFTRFYQGYILPNKFNIDKRKAHLSNLIFSNQITKEEALKELQLPIYPAEQLAIDKPFVLKKLGFSEEEFKDYMNSKPVPHEFYGGAEVINRKSLKTEIRMRLGAVKQHILK